VTSSSGRLAEITYALAENAALQIASRRRWPSRSWTTRQPLATVEDYYNQIAPSGREEFRLIVQTYARLALMQM
jgi:hypothetical protein